MTRDVSPILDRHTQERLGRMLRERLDAGRDQAPSGEIEELLASLRAEQGGGDEDRPSRH